MFLDLSAALSPVSVPSEEHPFNPILELSHLLPSSSIFCTGLVVAILCPISSYREDVSLSVSRSSLFLVCFFSDGTY